jgi:hypothetical protein
MANPSTDLRTRPAHPGARRPRQPLPWRRRPIGSRAGTHSPPCLDRSKDSSGLTADNSGLEVTPALNPPSAPRRCPHIRDCELFPRFALGSTLKIWKLHYCEGRFETCQRYVRSLAGRPVPSGLLPNGKQLDELLAAGGMKR